jgi:CubicO group peptidase (beta-lactamase class C family)
MTSSPAFDAAAFERLDASIQADIDRGENFGAAVLVAHAGEVVHRGLYGEVEPGRAAAADDRYMLMSMSKGYTAALCLQAIDHGRFGLDTRVADLVPGFGFGGKGKATVRQLFTHTAGLPAALFPSPLGPDSIGDLSAKVKAISALPALYTAGTRSLYTMGLGYDVLGQILVNTDPAGRSFREIAAQELFQPLGMQQTAFGASLTDPKRVPISHTPARTGPTAAMSKLVLHDLMDEHAEFPAGGAYGTIDDVLRFTEVWRGRGTSGQTRILSPAMFDYAALDHTPGLDNEAWTFENGARGFDPLPARFNLLGGYTRGTGHITHAAGQTASPRSIALLGGGSTAWMIDPERDLTVILLTAGFVEGLDHLFRVQRINDLALAAVQA